jgi:hypothetical protein
MKTLGKILICWAFKALRNDLRGMQDKSGGNCFLKVEGLHFFGIFQIMSGII